MRRQAVAAIAAGLLLAAAPGWGGDGHGHGEEDRGAQDGHTHADDEGHAQVEVDRLAAFGVTLATADPGAVDSGVELPGEVRANADRVAHLAPRYAGVLREVRARLGETVRAGATLAMVESATLAPFPLVAPFDGVVIDRNAVLGEAVSPERPILVIADLREVWVDIAVYQKDLPLVRVGQEVTLSAGYGIADARGRVSYLSPVLEHATRTATARVVLPNPDGRWRPGLFVSAVVEDPAPAAVTVPRAALQRHDGETVVFAVAGSHFVPRPVTVGRLGRTRAEILAGLRPGERVADANSFLIKAELEKGAGGHDH